jgi:G3E family GTPase
MVASANPIHTVPTNIITGFLGVGKTTTILHLLKSKPSSERWAVLVNEFGEIGVDGGLMQAQHGEAQGVMVREVPGGCMCCAAGLPMQVALNQLLQTARPDRLLIEPTGLGHPKEVLQVLNSGFFHDALQIERVITLVDARQLADSRYTENEIFNQQIEVADVIVGNKMDLYGPDDQAALQNYIRSTSVPAAKTVFTRNGELNASLLTGTSRWPGLTIDQTTGQNADHASHHQHPDTEQLTDTSLPACGYVTKINHTEGYHSIGWRFKHNMIFSSNQLHSFFTKLDAERAKAVVNTEKGVVGFNLAGGVLTEIMLFGTGQSCIEIIGASVDSTWEDQLLACLMPDCETAGLPR